MLVQTVADTDGQTLRILKYKITTTIIIFPRDHMLPRVKNNNNNFIIIIIITTNIIIITRTSPVKAALIPVTTPSQPLFAVP